MFESNPEFKRAGIDWLLANGRCESISMSTGLALARLAVSGVDYERSTAPTFGQIVDEPGDSFNEATYAKGIGATIYAADADPADWRDEYTFEIGAEDVMEIVVGAVIAGVIAAGKSPEQAQQEWTARAYPKEIERLRENAARRAERDRLATRDEAE